MAPKVSLAVLSLFCLSACVDTAAVQKFANESSSVSANASVINGSSAAFAAVKQYVSSPAMAKKYPDAMSLGPGTPEFDESQELAPKAAAVLTQYMQVLAKLAGDSTVFPSSDVSGIAASLNSLGITSDKVTPALQATSSLANFLTADYAKYKIKAIIDHSNPFVQKITAFLAKFAIQNATLYDKAKDISGDYWEGLVDGCEKAKGKQHLPVGCDATIALAAHVHAQEEALIAQQIQTADAAAAAFDKIGRDHQAIFDSAGKFDSIVLLDQLKADEPVLVSAIRDLSKL